MSYVLMVWKFIVFALPWKTFDRFAYNILKPLYGKNTVLYVAYKQTQSPMSVKSFPKVPLVHTLFRSVRSYGAYSFTAEFVTQGGSILEKEG